MIDADVLAAAGLRCESAGDVVTVTLDRPAKLNAQTPGMWEALAEIGRALPGDVRYVVVRGAGTSFSSGLDVAAFGSGTDTGVTVSQLAAMPEAAATELIAAYQRGFSWLGRADIVSVAAVHGHAIGAGFQLALACDLRLVADDAQFAMPEATYGLVPDLGGTAPLVRAVGYSRALELCLTGRRVSAAEARDLGLVNLVVPRAELAAATEDCLAALRATAHSTSTELKLLLRGALGRTAEQQLAAERDAQVRRLKNAAGIGD